MEIRDIEKFAIDPMAKVGHVHLNVANLDRSVAFYRDVLGLRVTLRLPKLAFVAAGEYPWLALDTRATQGGDRPAHGMTGLHHFAILHPTRQALAGTVKRVVEAGVRVTRSADFKISLAVFIEDPDGNGIELCWDRPREEWPEDWATTNGIGKPKPLDMRSCRQDLNICRRRSRDTGGQTGDLLNTKHPRGSGIDHFRK